MEMNESQQESFLTRMGLSSREKDLLRSRLQEALESKPLPSPSTMKWCNVPAILHGSIPKRDTPIVELPDVTSDVFTDAILESIIDILASKFRRLAEMEVLVRVFLMVMIAVSDKSDIRVELQPTLKDNATFTDFIIWATKKTGHVRFIEVKRADINVDLTIESDATAQTLREAHILFSRKDVIEPLAFALTNGSGWSFGIAERYPPSKLTLKSVHNVTCGTGNLSGWKLGIKYLRAFLDFDRTWPLPELHV